MKWRCSSLQTLSVGIAVIGNPDLQRARLNHFDLRYEMMHHGNNLVAVSAFYKYFENPIETVIQPTAQNRVSYENAESATNYGLEFELRQVVNSALSFSANLTLVNSEIQLSDETEGIQTSNNRPLQGQSPYLMNFSINYVSPYFGTTADAFFHVFGKRITQVGSNGMPDVYELPHPELDIILRQPFGENFSFKIGFENILDPEVLFEQGDDNMYHSYHLGRVYSIGFSWNY